MALDGKRIVVNRREQKLTLYKDDRFYRRWPISTGVAGRETPAGHYKIVTKARHPTYTYPDSDWVPKWLRGVVVPEDDPNNPITRRWMGLGNEGPIAGIGIHGTRDVEHLGEQASHGCIRMRGRDVVTLFDLVRKGTPVEIR